MLPEYLEVNIEADRVCIRLQILLCPLGLSLKIEAYGCYLSISRSVWRLPEVLLVSRSCSVL
jgi:hypothetical protein